MKCGECGISLTQENALKTIYGNDDYICKHCVDDSVGYNFCESCRKYVACDDSSYCQTDGGIYCYKCENEKLAVCNECSKLHFKELVVDGVCNECRNKGQEISEKPDILKYLKSVESDLYDLYNRLRDNYNDDFEFIQKEDDRLIIYNIIDLINDI